MRRGNANRCTEAKLSVRSASQTDGQLDSRSHLVECTGDLNPPATCDICAADAACLMGDPVEAIKSLDWRIFTPAERKSARGHIFSSNFLRRGSQCMFTRNRFKDLLR